MPLVRDYQLQDSALTLAEGLEEYFEANPGLTKVEPGAPEAELFLPHDACHVVFGTGTSLVEEAMTDFWTMFGADIGVGEYVRLMKHVNQIEPAQIAAKIGAWVIARDMVLGTPAMLRACWRARAMRAKWRFHDYEAQLHRPLRDIREELGIRVFLPRDSLREASSVAAMSAA